MSRFPETWRNTGYRRTRWCRTYRDYSVPVWCVAGQWEGKIYIDGKQVDIRNCQQAIARGIAMVPEDRKRDGIVPVMAVGKNITLAALKNLPVVLASLMTRQSKMYSGINPATQS